MVRRTGSIKVQFIDERIRDSHYSGRRKDCLINSIVRELRNVVGIEFPDGQRGHGHKLDEKRRQKRRVPVQCNIFEGLFQQ